MHDKNTQDILFQMIGRIKSGAQFKNAGMLLVHNGVVRQTTRDGKKKVKGLIVKVDHAVLDQIIANARSMPGIVDVQVHIVEDRFLEVGDDLMFLAVAGDLRENVSRVLMETLEAIKTRATAKEEVYSRQ